MAIDNREERPFLVLWLVFHLYKYTRIWNTQLCIATRAWKTLTPHSSPRVYVLLLFCRNVSLRRRVTLSVLFLLLFNQYIHLYTAMFARYADFAKLGGWAMSVNCDDAMA